MGKTIEQLKTLASQITNETMAGANTHQRVGGLFGDIADKFGDFYDKDHTYTKEQIDSLIGIPFVSVSTLPTASASTVGKIYLVPKQGSQDTKEMYVTVEDSGAYSWEKIGSTDVDLTDYLKKSDVQGGVTLDSDYPVKSSGLWTEFDELGGDVVSMSGVNATTVSKQTMTVADNYKAGAIFVVYDNSGVNQSQFTRDREYYVAKSDGANSGANVSLESTSLFAYTTSGPQAAVYSADYKIAAAVPNTRTVNGKALSSNITLNASDVGALPSSTTIPTSLSQLNGDSTHRTVADYEKTNWNDKYTKTEVNNMVSSLSDFTTEVGSLPQTGEPNVLYIVPSTDGESYTEYLYVNDRFVPLATHSGDIGAFQSMLNVPDIILDTPYINLGKFTKLNELELPYVDGVMRTDGTIHVVGTYKTYTIVNSDSTPSGRIKVVYSNFEGKTNLDGSHVNVEITDGSSNVVYRGRLQGARAIILQYGYTLRLSTESASQVYVQTTNGNVFYSSSDIADRFDFIKIYDYSESGRTASEGDLEYVNGLYGFGQAVNSSTSFSENYRTYIVDTTDYVKPVWCHFQTPNIGAPARYRLFCCCTNNADRRVLYEKSFISPANYIVQLSPNFVYYITASVVNIWDEGIPNYVLERAEMNYLIQPVYNVPQLSTRLTTQSGGWMAIGQKSIPTGSDANYIEYENTANSDVYMFVYGARNIGCTSIYKNITIIQNGIMVYAGVISSGLNVISVPYATKIIVCLYEYGYAGLISKDEFERVTSTTGGSGGTSILCGVGDSLTAGNTYLNILNGLMGGRFTIVNKGIGGESAATIFGRVNSIPYKVAEDIVIPASSSTSIEIKLKNDFGSWLLPLFQQGGNSGGCYIAGIEGTMTTNDSPYGLSATYYFNRKENGVATTVKAGEEILMSSNGVYGGIEPNATQIIWVGQNGGYKYGGETNRYQPENGSATAEDVALLVNMIKQHIEISKPSKFLVLSPPSNTNTILESEFLNNFRSAYINVREQMVLNGIPIALSKGYLTGNYPTAQDSQDIANGIVPSSLRADGVHFNTAGYSVLAELIKVKINTTWNIN